MPFPTDINIKEVKSIKFNAKKKSIKTYRLQRKYMIKY